MKTWVIAIVVALLYIHLFNAIAEQYFASGRTMTLYDLYRKWIPPMKITVEV